MRLVKKLFYLFFISVVMTSFGSCSKKTEIIETGNWGSEIGDVVNDIQTIEQSIGEGRIFRSATDEDKKGVIEALLDMRIASVRLSENELDSRALKTLYRAMKFVIKLQISVLDRARLDRVFVKIQSLVDHYAKVQGVLLEELGWPLFSYSFRDGLFPFLSRADSSKWEFDINQDRTHVKVSGQDNKSWLLSPAFDLTKSLNPRLKINHLVNINRNTGRYASDEFNRVLIMQTCFKAFISNDYETGDPEKANWQELDLGELPSGYDFHAVDSSEVNLSTYAGKSSTIALVFDMDTKKLGHHYITWQVNKFEILGDGPPLVYEGRVEEREREIGVRIFTHSFNDGFGEFRPLVLKGDNPAHFSLKTFQRSQYVRISSFMEKNEGTVMLISPIVDLTNVDVPKVRISQAYKFYEEEAMKQKYLQLVVANAENERDSWDALKWQGLDFKKLPRGDSFNPVVSEFIDLPPHLKGKRIRLGFKYTSKGPDFPLWDIHNIAVHEMKGFP